MLNPAYAEKIRKKYIYLYVQLCRIDCSRRDDYLGGENVILAVGTVLYQTSCHSAISVWNEFILNRGV